MPAKKREKKGQKIAYEVDRRISPLKIMKSINEGSRNPQTLSREERKACLVVMSSGQYRTSELAEMFGVTARMIRRDLQEIKREIGNEVRSTTMEEVLGDLALTAERASTMAFRHEDPGLGWKVKVEYVKLLRDLGVIGDQTRTTGLRVTIESLSQGHNRLRDALAGALDPTVTGEIVEAEGRVVESPQLPLGGKSPHGEEEDPDVEISVKEPDD